MAKNHKHSRGCWDNELICRKTAHVHKKGAYGCYGPDDKTYSYPQCGKKPHVHSPDLGCYKRVKRCGYGDGSE